MQQKSSWLGTPLDSPLVPAVTRRSWVPWAAFFASLSCHPGASQCPVPGLAWAAAWAPSLPLCSKDSGAE